MEPPIRILAIVPEPVGAVWSSIAASVWTSIEAALRSQTQTGRLEIVRLKPATANALEEALRREPFDVIHVVARGTSRAAARHGTVTLEASDGRARDVNAHNFATLCAGVPDLELVVLQAVGGAAADLDVLRDTVFQQTTSVLSVPGPTGATDSRDAARFAQVFYTGLASGKSLNEAFVIATQNPSGLPVVGVSPSAEPRLLVRGRQAPAAPPVVSRRKEAAPVIAPARDEDAGSNDARARPSEDAARAQRLVEQKRAARAFDVFLCHNVGDKPAVMEIGRTLMGRGVLPWLDQWELRPGTPWQRVLEEQISSIAAAAVFVGREGIGPWQRHELDGFLREFNKRGCPVIPVMLPGTHGEPELPLFLRGMTWVDFRVADPDPWAQLIWGITGQRPLA